MCFDAAGKNPVLHSDFGSSNGTKKCIYEYYGYVHLSYPHIMNDIPKLKLCSSTFMSSILCTNLAALKNHMYAIFHSNEELGCCMYNNM